MIGEIMNETVFINETSLFPEARITKHVYDRYNDRIEPDPTNVAYEEGTPTNSASNMVTVGHTSISEAKKKLILKMIGIVRRTDFPIGTSYGIKLLDFDLKPESVKFNSEQDRENSQGKNLVLYVRTDDRNYSVGDQLWLVTDRENNVPTLMFRRSYFPLTRWDKTVTIQDVAQGNI